MKLIIGSLCALLAAGTAQAYCKVKLPDGTWYYGDKCAQISREGMPQAAVEQSAPAVMKELQESRKRDLGVQRQRLQGYDYRDLERNPMRVREAEAVNEYQRR